MTQSAPRTGRLRLGVAALVVLVSLGACTGGRDPTAPDTTGIWSAVRVTSFDFSESRILGELYAAALERRGYRVSRILGLGPREVVQPALERGLVDIVPEYAGSALAYLEAADGTSATASRTSAPSRLRAALAGRSLVPLAFAGAQDQNGIAVTARFATAHQLRRISDLRPLGSGLSFAGPPECPQRPYCLVGLQRTYGLAFKSFIPLPTRAITAAALSTGEVSVGMLETTDGRLAAGELVLLADDRRLQPPENVVPVVRRALLARYGPRLVGTLDAVSARLSTAALVQLNRAVEVQGTTAARAAASWVARYVPR